MRTLSTLLALVCLFAFASDSFAAPRRAAARANARAARQNAKAAKANAQAAKAAAQAAKAAARAARASQRQAIIVKPAPRFIGFDAFGNAIFAR